MGGKSLINFVPATNNRGNDFTYGDFDLNSSKDLNEGPSAAEMYQEVLSMPITAIKRPVKTRQLISQPEQPPPQPAPTFKTENIFKFCQYGQLKNCKQWLSSGGDVNTRDMFKWTPLMVAVFGGHSEVVKLLLESGADTSLRDSKNLSAIDHAQKSGNAHLVELILEDQQQKKDSQEQQLNKAKTNLSSKSTKSQLSTPVPLECQTCGSVTDTSMDAHFLSIPHQLKSNSFSSEQTRALGNFAHVNRQFVGYRMLLKEGWNGYTGLGAQEDGRKYPVEAQANAGRACIGLPKPSKAQTNPPQMTAPFSRGKLKHHLKREEQKKRQFEANYRRSFY